MPKRTRRQFLEESMFAAAAAVAAGAPAELLAARPLHGRAAVDKLGVAVVGARGRGGTHIGALAGRRDTEILYICDVDGDVAQRRAIETAKRQGRQPRCERDLRKVLDDDRVDIVTIATPTHWHALAAVWSLQAGKDVYLETPISHNLGEGRRIVEAAQRYGRICQTGSQCRSHPGMAAAMRYLRDGRIGRVRLARATCYQQRHAIGPRGLYEPSSSVDYDLWLGPAAFGPLTRPRLHYDWHWQWPYGCGAIGNRGIHLVDLARWGLGADRHPDAVVAFGRPPAADDAGQTPRAQAVLCGFGDASLAMAIRQGKPNARRGPRTGVLFEGTDGYVVVTHYASGAAFDLEGNKICEFAGRGNHFANFLDAVRSRNPRGLAADAVQGHLSAALCHLGNISYRLGEPVTSREAEGRLRDLKTPEPARRALERELHHLRATAGSEQLPGIVAGAPLAFDPKRETFVGHDRADAMLRRDNRPPFVMPDIEQV